MLKRMVDAHTHIIGDPKELDKNTLYNTFVSNELWTNDEEEKIKNTVKDRITKKKLGKVCVRCHTPMYDNALDLFYSLYRFSRGFIPKKFLPKKNFLKKEYTRLHYKIDEHELSVEGIIWVILLEPEMGINPL